MLSRFKPKPADYFKTYSQCGEDRIVAYLFKQLGITNPSYIDIGAHHPTILSNTHLFYQNGSKGINIEPDPELFNAFNTHRPNDININAGIGTSDEKLNFYLMSSRVLNTFSEEEAKRIQAYGTYSIERVIEVQVIPLQQIVDQYFPQQSGPDFISLDVEGLDYAILASINLKNYTKTIFCVETINYAEDNSEKKNSEIFKYFTENGFIVYADTYINTIFINNKYWTGRKQGD